MSCNNFNKEYALKDKAIIDFSGMHYFNFSDVDGISINAKTIIILEEKYKWNNENTFFQQQLLNALKLPSILIKTSNPVDISNKVPEEKIIELKDSTVVDFLTNDSEKFNNWFYSLKKVDSSILKEGVNVNTLLDFWKLYIYGNNTEWWMNVPISE